MRNNLTFEFIFKRSLVRQRSFTMGSSCLPVSLKRFSVAAPLSLDLQAPQMASLPQPQSRELCHTYIWWASGYGCNSQRRRWRWTSILCSLGAEHDDSHCCHGIVVPHMFPGLHGGNKTCVHHWLRHVSWQRFQSLGCSTVGKEVESFINYSKSKTLWWVKRETSEERKKLFS